MALPHSCSSSPHTFRFPCGSSQFTFARSGGPGGQNVNKVNTKALLRWPVATSPSLPDAVRQRLLAKYRRRITAEGDLLVISQRFRDAGRNAADCLEKLRPMLAEAAAARPPPQADAAHPGVGAAPHRKQAAALAKEAATRHGRGRLAQVRQYGLIRRESCHI